MSGPRGRGGGRGWETGGGRAATPVPQKPRTDPRLAVATRRPARARCWRPGPERGHSGRGCHSGLGETALAGPARGNWLLDGAAAGPAGSDAPPRTRRGRKGACSSGRRARRASGAAVRRGSGRPGPLPLPARPSFQRAAARSPQRVPRQMGPGVAPGPGGVAVLTAAVQPGNRAPLPGGQAAAGGWRFPRAVDMGLGSG